MGYEIIQKYTCDECGHEISYSPTDRYHVNRNISNNVVTEVGWIELFIHGTGTSKKLFCKKECAFKYLNRECGGTVDTAV